MAFTDGACAPIAPELSATLTLGLLQGLPVNRAQSREVPMIGPARGHHFWVTDSEKLLIWQGWPSERLAWRAARENRQ